MKNIEKEFNVIDEVFNKIMAKQRAELENAAIKPIDEKLPFAQNGITGLIAPPGSGKTYTYLKLICQQEVLREEPFFELVVICSTSAKFDKTVETFKDAIKKSKLVCVKDSDLLAWLNKYMRRILKYNAMMNYINSNFKKKDDEIERILSKHRFKNKNKEVEYLCCKLTKYNWKTFPHRCLLIFDDFASHPLIRSKETELSRLLKKLRHFNINVMICVQLWNEYQKLNNQHDSFRIHIYANKVLIVRSINKS